MNAQQWNALSEIAQDEGERRLHMPAPIHNLALQPQHLKTREPRGIRVESTWSNRFSARISSIFIVIPP